MSGENEPGPSGENAYLQDDTERKRERERKRASENEKERTICVH